MKVYWWSSNHQPQIKIWSDQLTWSSQTQACIFRYESLPFSVSLSQDFGFDSNSDTVPWLKPSTYLVVTILSSSRHYHNNHHHHTPSHLHHRFYHHFYHHHHSGLTYLANNRWPMLWTERSSRTLCKKSMMMMMTLMMMMMMIMTMMMMVIMMMNHEGRVTSNLSCLRGVHKTDADAQSCKISGILRFV